MIRGLSSKGQSLVGIMVSVAITTGIVIAATQLLTNQSKFAHATSQRLDLAELQGLMIQAFRNTVVCSCQLDPAKNISIASRLKINPSSPADINLETIRSSCDFASSDNIIAKTADRLMNSNNSIKVSSVVLEDIERTGTTDSFHGKVSVQLEGISELVGSKKISIPILFAVDSNLGTATSRPISYCIGDVPGVGIDSCPAGWRMVGPPNVAGTYCMQQSPMPITDFASAATYCPTLKPLGRNRAQVCLRDQLELACVLGTFSGMPAPEFFNQNYTSGATTLVVNAGGCSEMSFHSATAQFRCCVQ